MGANGLGMLVGPIIGGFLYEYAGYRSSFILCAGNPSLLSSPLCSLIFAPSLFIDKH